MLNDRLAIVIPLITISVWVVWLGGPVYTLCLAGMFVLAAREYVRIFRAAGNRPAEWLLIVSVSAILLVRAFWPGLEIGWVLAFTAVAALLWHLREYEHGRQHFRQLFGLWLVTGLGLLGYMNFRPGFSLGYNLYPDASAHEVRERDYFFVGSFVVWGLWAGIGLAGLLRRLLERRVAPLLAAIPLALVALAPFAGNFTAASRRHGPDATLAADFAYNLLNSVPPYGILFTYGDNDTFPPWWAQEVKGIRQGPRGVPRPLRDLVVQAAPAGYPAAALRRGSGTSHLEGASARAPDLEAPLDDGCPDRAGPAGAPAAGRAGDGGTDPSRAAQGDTPL